jgi:hypothetical protein
MTLEELHRIVTNPAKDESYEIHLAYLWKKKDAQSIFYITGLDVSGMFNQEAERVYGESMPDTTTIRIDNDDFCGVTCDMPVTDCCGIGPITNENYCPNCGKKITKEKGK